MGTLFALGCAILVGFLCAQANLPPIQALIVIIASACILTPISYKLFE